MKRSPYLPSLESFERDHFKPKPGRALIVGSRVYKTRRDRRRLYDDAVGIDMLPGDGVDYIINLEDEIPYYLGPFAHIDCISVLEHSKRPWQLAANIEWLMKPGTTLYLQVPFVWRVHGYPNDYWRFTVEGVRLLFPTIQWHALQFVPVSEKGGVLNIEQDEWVYFAKTEICGFGFKP